MHWMSQAFIQSEIGSLNVIMWVYEIIGFKAEKQSNLIEFVYHIWHLSAPKMTDMIASLTLKIMKYDEIICGQEERMAR